MVSYADSNENGRERRDLGAALFVLLLAVVAYYLPSTVQGQIAAALRASVLRPFLLTQEALQLTRLKAEDAELLQARLDSLAGVIVSQGNLAEENRRLRELLAIRQDPDLSFVPAVVIRPGTEGSESMFLLNVGEGEGIRPGDPVLVREGGIALVGVIKEVRGGNSIGIDWSHPDFRASGMTADGRVFGLVEPVRGVFREADRLLLNGVPFYERPDSGTLITTSGLGGVYPRGIPIGTVERLAEEEGTWRRAYWLRPAVHPGSLTHVLVVSASRRADATMERFLEEGGAGRDGAAGGADSTSRPGGGEGGGA